MRLGRLPNSLKLLLASLAIACGAVPVKTEQVLTPETFKTSVASGVWLVEHFSPYCGHCKAFAPTWEELIKYSEAEVPGITLAQVNCAVNGDLCDANGVKGYPTLQIFKDGQFVEKYTGNRVLDKLVPFIKRHATPPPSPPPSIPAPPKIPEYIPNTNGAVAVLDDKTFDAALALGPTFVKFYAPWCGHCKKLAPIWAKLAKLFQGKLAIAEVDCDANKALCNTHGIEGYPTLAYFSAGVKNEYSGGRKLEQLAAFVEKANAPPSKAIAARDLDTHIQESPVAYVLLHDTDQVPQALLPMFASLLGSPPVFTIAHPPESLLTKYGVAGTWTLLAFKDHDSSSPTSILSASTADMEIVADWLLINRLPTTAELTQDSFQSIMKSPAKPLVLLAAVSEHNKEALKARFEILGKGWRTSKHDREVVFAWMDVERWADWMSSMYGLSGKSHTLSDVQAVVADHQELVYWDKDGEGSLINIMDEKSIYSALDGAASGAIRSIHSENIMERMARFLNTKMSSFESFIIQRPMQTVFCFLLFIVVLIFGLRRWIMSDLPDDRYYRDKGRLD